MAQIHVTNLTFGYEGSSDDIFENVSFSVDTNWKLGFLGRNGKGKTTFLKLLLGEYPYSGSITTSTVFDYFPYRITEAQRKQCAAEFIEELKTGCEQWRVICELEKMKEDAEILYRPFDTLSNGQQTKVLLAVLFSGENDFLLIDEPTNHLDRQSRENVQQYLQGKKGYILVSHDRELLDACIDHVLVLNRKSIEVQSGNFSSWWENKKRKDAFAVSENEKHLREIASLKRTAQRSRRWADKNESTKIGFDPVKEPDRFIGTRSYIGSKTKKMQSRVTQYERRMEREIAQKEGLLTDIENPDSLRLNPLSYHKDRLMLMRDVSVRYADQQQRVLEHFNFELMQGERVFLHGENGCGKSTLIRTILSQIQMQQDSVVVEEGEVQVPQNLIISYVNQDTGFLRGSVREFCENRNLEESLFFTLLRKLDMERSQFTKNLEDFSEGQKKKVLIAASLMTPAHLYIWAEPLNYIDVFSRMQIEELIQQFQPTMLLVEHDVQFREKIATRIVEMDVLG